MLLFDSKALKLSAVQQPGGFRLYRGRGAVQRARHQDGARSTNQNGVAYVRDASWKQARVGTREHANGVKFVQTYADRVWTDNLLAQPECR